MHSRRRAIAAALALLTILALPASLDAHAVVFPKASTTGAYERYVLRVPNEREVPTIRVEIRFPDAVRVTSFGEVPGWKLQLLTDTAQRIIGAVWSGGLAPKHFVEFPFIAANPKEATTLRWVAIQSYAGGETVAWDGAEGSRSPASVTVVAAPDTAHAEPAAPPAPRSGWVPWAALAVAVLSLGLALRRPAAARG